MTRKLFYDQVISSIQQVGSTIPLDVVLMRAPIRFATVIDAGDVIGDILGRHFNKYVSFKLLQDARPPVGQENLFVEFSATCVFPPPENQGMFGVHIVPYAIAKSSIMFTEKVAPLKADFLQEWDEVYAMLTYRKMGGEIVTAFVGMILGVNMIGSVSAPGFFRLSPDLGAPYDYTQARGQVALFGYSVFKCFSLINQRKFLLARVLGECDEAVYRMVKGNDQSLDPAIFE